ncbi:hypothetical protein CVT25_011424 [Psilocybe cyanescens]|uniref:DUF6534 domain-containing protein n=1 Tax=Psilocybe cyanescens TaxID=93625 RepID=A0A409WGA7_PSICY|nr:hypothetical protein CVT25_011424 [Psilocybe cyanescens]
MVGLPTTYGALLLGALFASCFSGIITSQCIVYFKLFPNDTNFLKGLRCPKLILTTRLPTLQILVVWLFDVGHTGLVWSAMWQYTIIHYGNTEYIDYIPNFFAYRIWLPCASTRTPGIRLKSYVLFRKDFRWLFSLGLGFSSGADVLITVLLFFLLQGSRSKLPNLNVIIDSLILYTFEIGSLTRLAGSLSLCMFRLYKGISASMATVASMICPYIDLHQWILLDDSLIFLGLHFVIGKRQYRYQSTAPPERTGRSPP